MTIQAKVEELAEALGRSIDDTEALLRTAAATDEDDQARFTAGISPDP